MPNSINNGEVAEIARNMILKARAQGFTDDQILQIAQQNSLNQPTSYSGGETPYRPGIPVPLTTSNQTLGQDKETVGRLPKQGSSSSPTSQQDGMFNHMTSTIVDSVEAAGSDPKKQNGKRPRLSGSSTSSTQQDGMFNHMTSTIVDSVEAAGSDPKKQNGKRPRLSGSSTSSTQQDGMFNHMTSTIVDSVEAAGSDPKKQNGKRPRLSGSSTSSTQQDGMFNHMTSTIVDSVEAAGSDPKKRGRKMPKRRDPSASSTEQDGTTDNITSTVIQSAVADSPYRAKPTGASSPVVANPVWSPPVNTAPTRNEIEGRVAPTVTNKPFKPSNLGRPEESHNGMPAHPNAAFAPGQGPGSTSMNITPTHQPVATNNPRQTSAMAPKPRSIPSGGSMTANPHENNSGFPPPAVVSYATPPRAGVGKTVAF